ncbi:hypothetical protein EB234_17490 [Mesorhizobium japonicum R7A]|nr:hypothetical protein EB234_17490 [Mesorhizobium japonicum R7A]
MQHRQCGRLRHHPGKARPERQSRRGRELRSRQWRACRNKLRRTAGQGRWRAFGQFRPDTCGQLQSAHRQHQHAQQRRGDRDRHHRCSRRLERQPGRQWQQWLRLLRWR